MKDLVEVADNLQRAAETVPAAVLEGKDADGQPLSPARALALLQSLLQGVHLTERQLQQARRLCLHDWQRPVAFSAPMRTAVVSRAVSTTVTGDIQGTYM